MAVANSEKMEREREKGDKPTAKPTVRSSDDVIPLAAPSSLRLVVVVVDVEGWLNDEDEGCRLNLVVVDHCFQKDNNLLINKNN